MKNKTWRDEVTVELFLDDLLEKTLPREWCVKDMLHKMAWDKLYTQYPRIDYVNDFNTAIEDIETWSCGRLHVVFSVTPKDDE